MCHYIANCFVMLHGKPFIKEIKKLKRNTANIMVKVLTLQVTFLQTTFLLTYLHKTTSLSISASRWKSLKLSIWSFFWNHNIFEAWQGKIMLTNGLSMGLLAVCNHAKGKHVITEKYVERSDCKTLSLRKQWETILNLLTLQWRNSRRIIRK